MNAIKKTEVAIIHTFKSFELSGINQLIRKLRKHSILKYGMFPLIFTQLWRHTI